MNQTIPNIKDFPQCNVLQGGEVVDAKSIIVKLPECTVTTSDTAVMLQVSDGTIFSFDEQQKCAGSNEHRAVFRGGHCSLKRKRGANPDPYFVKVNSISNLLREVDNGCCNSTVNEIIMMRQFSTASNKKYHQCNHFSSLVSAFRCQMNIYLVIPSIQGRPLSDLLLSSTRHQYVHRIFKQIINILAYLKSEFNAYHLDIKPENIMYCNHAYDCFITLLDFGSCRESPNDILPYYQFGTRLYMAPELTTSSAPEVLQPSKIDMWAAGVTFLVLMLPMNGNLSAIQNVLQRLQNNNVELRIQFLQQYCALSADEARVCACLLEPSVAERWSIEQIQNSAYWNSMH